jgi:RNA polymerase-binding transcription factor DksA
MTTKSKAAIIEIEIEMCGKEIVSHPVRGTKVAEMATPTVKYQKLLENERAALLNRIKRLYSSEPYCEFTNVAEVAVLQALEQKLAQVNNALHEVKFGHYGICEICGAKIESARLAAMPSASTCLGCMDRHEHKFKTVAPNWR